MSNKAQAGEVMSRNATHWCKAGETVAVPKPKTLNDWLMLGQSAAAPARFNSAQWEAWDKANIQPHSPPNIDPLGR